MLVTDKYDVIVVGAGHAGVEAALACSRLGKKTLLTTLSLDNIALMPCNPSLGGPAKGHLVREIDALGGQMALTADQACIQMRMLNTGKGNAVHALRSQEDKLDYQMFMKEIVEKQINLDVKQLMIDEVVLSKDEVAGVKAESGEFFACQCLILATGTYLRGKIIYGEVVYEAGPNGLRAANKLSASLENIGLDLRRFKTGTPARIDAASLDYSKMSEQKGDSSLYNFSFMDEIRTRKQYSCWLTYTNQQTHQVIKDNLDRAAMFTGLVEGVGPRYCPSIESKIVRFGDKDRHQLFLEPEGLRTREMYVQGMSSSLPAEVQLQFLQTIAGMERVKMMRAGYAIDYDCLNPLQLQLSLEHKQIRGLFSAGQANGSSGYEEAAAQGLMAGINACLKIDGKEPFVLKRSDGYIGVLIDDLVTKGTDEPYRMMTSRAEYRLLLRQDNADLRLTSKGHDLGLVTEDRYSNFCHKRSAIERTLAILGSTNIAPNEATQAKMIKINSTPLRSGISLLELLRRQEISYAHLVDWFEMPRLHKVVEEQIEVEVKYEGYIKKQKLDVEKSIRMEEKTIPNGIEYDKIIELSSEGREKLNIIQPRSIGQAARISGVSPSDVSVLLVYLEKKRRGKNND